MNPESVGDLWNSYYVPLIADALDIASLRHVLEERIRVRGVGHGEWSHYLKELARIARDYNEKPLSTDVEQLLGTVTPQRVVEPT